MDSVGSYEAKTHLPRLLLDVAHGRSVTITKHGVPVARLVPPDPDTVEPASVIAAIKQARLGITLGDLSVGEAVEEGRR